VLERFLFSFVPLFFAFDAFGVLPFYLKLSHAVSPQRKETLLRDSILTSFLTTLLFATLGNRVMIYIGISLRDFFIAGGIVLFVIAIKDIVDRDAGPVFEEEMLGVVPLGIPLLAGPAVLTTSMVIVNRYGLFWLLFSLALNLLICFYVMKFSERIVKFLGKRVIEALSKIFSLIIASIAIMFVRKGLEL
jgi:multiple antibiotic resistance protein